jgi:hypothetical protein
MNQPPNFNRLARLYRWLELASFGPALGWCRCAYLKEMTRCKRALVLGDGDGRFTAQLLDVNPAVRVDTVDASTAMLKELLRRVGSHADRVRTHLADARNWQPQKADSPYDLIVTHFFLDCLTTEEVSELASRLRQAASPSVLWVVSEFDLPAGWFGSVVARPLVSVLYCAFGWMTGLRVRTLPDYRSSLRGAGFALQKRRQRLGGLLVSELWSVNPLDSVRG